MAAAPRPPRAARGPRRLAPLADFLHTEAAGGVLLVVAAAVALVWANSPWKGSYQRLWDAHLAVTAAGHTLELSLRHWLNDGLMTIFFLIVGLEIKRETTGGHLVGRRAVLPAIAAIGGMAVPAIVYLAIAGGTAAHGWGVPMATDIALAVGVIALVGDRVPRSLRAFLLGLAIVDDIGAILVIAIFYSSGIGWGWLAAAIGAIGLAVAARAAGVRWALPYWLLCWFALHEAGVHPTLAGVAMGLLAPVTPYLTPEFVDGDDLLDVSTVEAAHETTVLARHSVSVVEWLQHVLHPWTSYLIVPAFALANAGIEISRSSMRDALGNALFWGIVVGLVVGKPLGILLASRLAVAGRLADPVEGHTPRASFSVAASAGIGFTVALFVAELAFTDAAQLATAKLAILAASVVSGVIAYAAVAAGAPRRSSRTR